MRIRNKRSGHEAELYLPQRNSIASSWLGHAMCYLSIVCAPVLRAQIVQPQEPVDPSPINGETYYLINRLSGLQVDLNGNSVAPGDKILENTRSFSSLSQRWAFTKMPDGNWKASNIGNSFCLDASSAGGSPSTVQNPCALNTPSQEWTFTYVNNGYNAITNVATGEVLDTVGESASVGTQLNQTPLSGTPAPSQQWLFRPAYWRGNDMSTAEVEEYDRSTPAENTADLPWWHDAYLPGQDMLQIFKNAGLNAIRIRPASISATYQYGNLIYPMPTGPYTKYTLGGGSSTTFPINQTSQVFALTNPGFGAVESDWSGVDLAVRAKKLGMSVFLNLFYDGNGGSNPGNWVNEPLAALAGTPENPNGGNGQYLVYNYVKQLLEFYRAAGAMPDLVALGNEANLGLFSNLDGSNYTPSGPTMSAAATAFQLAGLQAVADAATDTSNPALLGAPVAVPLRCVDIDGTPNLDTFFKGPRAANIPIDVGCQSYYPGWGGPMTQAQYSYTPHGNTNGSFKTPQNVEETTMNAEIADPAAGYPIFTSEDGVAYTNVGGDTPLDDYYGSQLRVTPNPASRAIEREYYIDLESVQHNATNHMGMGMDCWACETTPMSGDAYSGTGNGNPGQYWLSAQLGFFDNSTSAIPGSGPGEAALDNATLPALMGMGGKTDPTLSYMLVNAVNGGILETPLASTAAAAPLDTAQFTGIVSQHQQWQILAQGADVEVYTGAPYNGTTGSNGTNLMNNLGDGYFQIVNQNQSAGINVLDNAGATVAGSAVVQNPESVIPTSIIGTNANQEWDIMTVGNCGDVPANCTNPPLTALGDYYMIVNKNSGLVLALAGSAIQQQEPAAASNGDWMVPANKGQLWQIFPVHISASSAPTTLVFGAGTPSTINGGTGIGVVNVDVENNAASLIGSPSEPVTLTITGPDGFSQSEDASSSSGVAVFNLSGVILDTPGSYTLSATSPGLTAAATSLSVAADVAVNLQVSNTQLVYPGATNITACIAPATQATATGSVRIYDGTTLLSTLSVQGGGCAYWYISPGLNAGTHLLTAIYSGDSNNPSGASAPVTLTVSPVPVNMGASCWNSSFPYGANYQCTVNASSNAGSALGSISYTYDGGAPVLVPLSGGNAQFTITEPIAGSHTVVIGYAQQTNYAAAAASNESFTVTPAPVYVALTPSSWYTSVGSTLTFQAVVTSWSAGAPNANGSVAFYDGGNLLATVPVNSSGQASYSTSALSTGSHNITATYANGTNYASGSSSVNITLAQ
jgi:arabinogalactan endo-1,4-beta-galactosidase